MNNNDKLLKIILENKNDLRTALRKWSDLSTSNLVWISNLLNIDTLYSDLEFKLRSNNFSEEEIYNIFYTIQALHFYGDYK